MIGLSLSFCISDILAKRKSIDDLDALVVGVAARPGTTEWENVIQKYRESYWQNQVKADIDDALERIIAKCPIYVPRLDIGDEYCPMIGKSYYPNSLDDGNWVNNFDAIVWSAALPYTYPVQKQLAEKSDQNITI